jgi:hypothetical protein
LQIIGSIDVDSQIQSLLPSISTSITEKLQKLITLLSARLQDLRQVKISKQTTLAKFKDLAGSNWKTSNLCNVISAISTHLYDLDACIKRTVSTVDGCGHACAELNDCQEFCTESILNLAFQSNYRHLREMNDHVFSDSQFRFLKRDKKVRSSYRQYAFHSPGTRHPSKTTRTL